MNIRGWLMVGFVCFAEAILKLPTQGGLFLLAVVFGVYLFPWSPPSILRLSPEGQARYNRETHYLESLVYHVAFQERAVTEARICALVPGLAECSVCRERLSRVFEWGVLKRDFLIEQTTGRAVLTAHRRRCVEYAGHFQDLGEAWVLPARKIRFTHAACHTMLIREEV